MWFSVFFHSHAHWMQRNMGKNIAGKQAMQPGQLCGLEREKREEAINQTFRHHNSAWVISLIKSVWVFPATSSLLNMGQTGIDFTENEFSSARHINYLSSQLKLKWMVEAQNRKNTTRLSPHTKRKEEVGSKLERRIKKTAGCYSVVIWQLEFSHLQSLNL